MQKRVLSMLLALCLLAGALPMMASAGNTFQDSLYVKNGITWHYRTGTNMGSDKKTASVRIIEIPPVKETLGLQEVTIPEKLDGCPVTELIQFGMLLPYTRTFKKLHIPQTVVYINASSGAGSGYEEVVLDGNNPAFATKDGVLYTKDMTELVFAPRMKKAVTIPDGVVKIRDFAFMYENEGLDKTESVVVPDSVTEIGYGCFTECKSLTVYGSEGSYIQQYAKENNVPFKVGTPGGQTPDSDAPSDPTYPGTPFTDISSHWGRESIKWAYEKALFSGVSDTRFGPEQTMTRGMLVTVLHRLAGKPEAAEKSGFSDVADGAYYEAAVNWAAETGISGGTGNGKFSPKTNITREQLASMLYRYAKLNETVSGGGGLSEFTDANKISSYAKEAVAWAVGEGIMSGKGGGRLDPQGRATRGEVAAVLQRYAG